MPMAGMGQRFANEGYKITKPLIPISGKPMVAQAVDDLPPAQYHHFVLRADMPYCDDIQQYLQRLYPNAGITHIPEVTEGQAITALIGLEALLETNKNHDALAPFTFGACDNGMIYDAQKLNELLNDDNVDVIIWGASNHSHAVRNPHMFGWIDADETGLISDISVKTPLSSPETDPIVTGVFTFKRAHDFQQAVQNLIKRDGRINGEFYLDSCINDAIAMGLKCYLLPVQHFISWGTPNDLKTFNYWQSCFHKWQTHPYQLEYDNHMEPTKITELNDMYQKTIPIYPKKSTLS